MNGTQPRDPLGCSWQSVSIYEWIVGFKDLGKERDVESQYDYFGAWYYDARIGRWLAVEPLAQKYPAYSPFLYSADKPIRFFDFDGRDVRPAGEMVRVFNVLVFESPLFARRLESINRMLGPIDVPFESKEKKQLDLRKYQELFGSIFDRTKEQQEEQQREAVARRRNEANFGTVK